MSEAAIQVPSAEPRQKKRVLIGCTGSVASVKVPLLAEELLKTGKVSTSYI